MKKIKLMLTATAVFAVLGGSFAFKARNFTSIILTGTASNSCPNVTPDFTFTQDESSPIFATINGGDPTNCTPADLSEDD